MNKKRRDWLKAKAGEKDDWLLCDQDECWLSYFAPPHAFAWAEPGAELRLVQRTPVSQEPQKALACFGAVRHDTQETVLYLLTDSPIASICGYSSSPCWPWREQK